MGFCYRRKGCNFYIFAFPFFGFMILIFLQLLPECSPRSVAYILELLSLRHCAGCHFYRAEGRGHSWDTKGNHIKDVRLELPWLSKKKKKSPTLSHKSLHVISAFCFASFQICVIDINISVLWLFPICCLRGIHTMSHCSSK